MADARKRIIRILERIHLAHWLIERLISLAEHVEGWHVVAAAFAAWATWASSAILAAHWWVDALLAIGVGLAVLFYGIPRKKGAEHTAMRISPPTEHWNSPFYFGVEM